MSALVLTPIALTFVAVGVVLLVPAIRIVREYERIVVFRLGHLRGAGGGAHHAMTRGALYRTSAS